MAKRLSAFDILSSGDEWSIGGASLVVLVGDDSFLAKTFLDMIRDTVCPEEADWSWAWREFTGDEDFDPRDVFDEAATIPLFSGATRVAVVRQADAFVSSAREKLEAVVAKKQSQGVIVLEVKSFPSNTRLAKAAIKTGVVVDISVPPKANLARWVKSWSLSHHGLRLSGATSQQLVDRIGNSLGLLDQAMQRLAAAIEPSGKNKTVPPEWIDDMVVSKKDQTAWGMIDAAAVGDTNRAIRQLAELLASGENVIGISAQSASVFRKLSSAARLLSLPRASGRPAGVELALRDAGVAAWPKAMNQAKDALKHLGPRRARRLPLDLYELDRSLKSESSRGLRARLALERFFCKMNGKVKSGKLLD